ncbi:hypothetical protein AgCh_011317 [Apium graveolens]
MIPDMKSEGRESQVWFLDNGANNHMTGQREKFKDIDESVNVLVRFRYGSTVNIKGKGTVAFKCKNREEMILREVYFIQMLRNNIISLGQMIKDGNNMVLDVDLLRIHDERGRLLIRVTRSANRLYKISLEESAPMCLMLRAKQTTWLWHERMGHVNFQALTQMSKDGLARGLPELMITKKYLKDV